MSTTEILCCHSGVWAILIGGTEIIYGVVSTILTPLGYRTLWFLTSDDKDTEGTLTLPVVMSVMFIVMGSLLMAGTLKESYCYLRTCFTVKVFLFVLFTISEIVEVKSKGPVTVVDGLITLAIPCFVIWVVRVRIRDMEVPKGSNAFNTQQCNNNTIVRKPVCTCGQGYVGSDGAAVV